MALTRALNADFGERVRKTKQVLLGKILGAQNYKHTNKVNIMPGKIVHIPIRVESLAGKEAEGNNRNSDALSEAIISVIGSKMCKTQLNIASL